ncbi:MAG: hypothetical protein M1819_003064 [Sarea resinae]|nr:MAG: hypothetical protein M1819_003064 [Sarea resinae]
MEEPERIAITICGDGGCGKSSITLRLVHQEWTNGYDPTIEDSYTLSLAHPPTSKTYTLSLTDTAGQEEYRSLFSATSLSTADAFLLVYDITSAPSLDALDYFHDLITMEAETRDERHHVPPVCVVAGNKCDLQSARQVRSAVGLEWARQRGYGFMETSAREMVNVHETFALIISRVVEARAAHRLRENPPVSSAAADGAGGEAGTSNRAEKHQTVDSVDLEDRPGHKTQRGGFWARLKCW